MTRPLKIRALLVCLDEAQRWGLDPTAQTSRSLAVLADRVAEYHSGAVRGGRNVGAWAGREHVRGRYLDWCASSQGWAESQAAEPGEALPPWRLGSFSEVWCVDAMGGARGRVVTIEQVRGWDAWPTPGSLAIFNRGGGRGHVERVIQAGRHEYQSIGGNEISKPGRWQVEWRDYDDPQLVGFCECDPISDDDLHSLGEALGRMKKPTSEGGGVTP